jgi:hypothetical protein
MYNGVGLTSVRGTATNGYVQRNLAHSKPKTKVDYNKEMEKAMAKPSLGETLRTCCLSPFANSLAAAPPPGGGPVSCVRARAVLI